MVDDEHRRPQTAARMRRLDLRVLIGLALLLVGVLGTLAIVRQAGQRTPVLVMARTVQAGQVIAAQDVRVAELGTASGVATLGAADRARVVGRRAAVPLAAGQVLGPAVVADGPALGSGQVAMSVALAPEHAAAGLLRAGDRVAVVASGKPGETGVGSGVLLSPVSVLSVLTRGDDSGADRKLLVSLAIRPEQAATLARAAARAPGPGEVPRLDERRLGALPRAGAGDPRGGAHGDRGRPATGAVPL